jgi:hypothetical protein
MCCPVRVTGVTGLGVDGRHVTVEAHVGGLTELLIELEDKEWARQWFVERPGAAPA